MSSSGPSEPHQGWVPQVRGPREQVFVRGVEVSILRPGKPPLSSTLIGPAIILVAAAIATAPILLHGSFCGDDLEFHTISWFDVHQSWLHGIFYPHWMPSANYNAGEPRFMFYPPLTWMLGTALGFVLPWPLVPIAMIFLFLAATGLAVRALAIEALSDAPATLAGCAALFSCFALFTAYERTAFAELTGGFWIPLLLLYALRDRDPSATLIRRALDGSTLPLTSILAGCWLSDGPVGVMASYLLVAVALAASTLARTWAHLLRASIAAMLGIALPALYLIPAAHEQGWVYLHAAVNYPVFNIENNWLFAHSADPLLAPFQFFIHRASTIAVIMIGVALLALLVLFLRQKFALQSGSSTFTRSWLIPLALIPIAVLFLLFPISLPIWNLLPKMRFLQYPWRWILAVEAPMAIFFAAAVWPGKSAQRWQRTAVASLCTTFFLTLTLFSARTFLRVCNEGDTVADLLDQYRGGGGLEGTDEYEPPDSDHWKIATNLPGACFSTDSDTILGVAATLDAIPSWSRDQHSCESTATAALRQPEQLRIETETTHPGFLILRLLSYPAWRITVNGHATDPADSRDDGLIAIPVPQGRVEVAVDWTTTPDVVAGRCVSAVALLLLIALGFLERRPNAAQ